MNSRISTMTSRDERIVSDLPPLRVLASCDSSIRCRAVELGNDNGNGFSESVQPSCSAGTAICCFVRMRFSNAALSRLMLLRYFCSSNDVSYTKKYTLTGTSGRVA